MINFLVNIFNSKWMIDGVPLNPWWQRCFFFSVGWSIQIIIYKYCKKRAKIKTNKEYAYNQLVRAIEFACDEDLWESNGEYNELFKYKYQVWYQGQLETAWENYKYYL